VNPQLAITCPFLCDRDERRGQQLGIENYGYFVYGLGHYSFFGEHEPGKTDIWHEYKTNPHEFVPPEGRVQDCVGTPEMIRARLREFEDAGIDQVVCLSQAGRIPHELLCSSIELFSKEVLPEFKERDQRSAPRAAERRARITEKAMLRKPKVETVEARTIIRAAGHH
jgi:alkanesulfonate monooxygenase SsuD/methylene tetrahydromethanopterin reductase-like flavin-dependent oxidoreductase (luciferase family)